MVYPRTPCPRNPPDRPCILRSPPFPMNLWLRDLGHEGVESRETRTVKSRGRGPRSLIGEDIRNDTRNKHRGGEGTSGATSTAHDARWFFFRAVRPRIGQITTEKIRVVSPPNQRGRALFRSGCAPVRLPHGSTVWSTCCLPKKPISTKLRLGGRCS